MQGHYPDFILTMAPQPHERQPLVWRAYRHVKAGGKHGRTASSGGSASGHPVPSFLQTWQMSSMSRSSRTSIQSTLYHRPSQKEHKFILLYLFSHGQVQIPCVAGHPRSVHVQ